MESRNWFAVIFSLMAIAWAGLLVLVVPQAVCDGAFDPLRAEFRRSHTDDEGKRLAGQYCARFGSVIRGSVALAVAPAVILNGICAMMWVSARHRSARVVLPSSPAVARDD